MTMPRSALPWLLLTLLFFAPTRGAQAQTAHPWQSLSPVQQQLLAPFRDKWRQLSPRRQQHLFAKSAHWATLPPPQREKITERIARWQRMTPEQRAQMRRDIEQFHRLPPARQAQLRAAFQRFQQMSPQRRQRLLHQWRSQTPEERQRWRMRSMEPEHGFRMPPPGMHPFGGPPGHRP